MQKNKIQQLIMWVAVLFACFFTYWPSPESKAQPAAVIYKTAQLTVKDSISIEEAREYETKSKLAQTAQATNATLDKLARITAKKKVRELPEKMPTAETVYFQLDSVIYEKPITRQGGLLVINLDSIRHELQPGDEIEIIESGTFDPDVIPVRKPTLWQKFKSIFKRKK